MSGSASVNLAENEYVKQLIEIFRQNGLDADAKGLAELAGCVMAAQVEISKTIGELTSELSALREERNHPVKTMLEKAADGLIARLKSIQQSLESLKDKIIAFCKSALKAFKDHGVVALNDAVMGFDIKRDLERARNSINDAIDYNNGQIAKIEAVSAEMHAAGRSIRNIGRAIRGKEPIPGIKPNGKLAQLAEAPFRSQIRRLNRSLGRVNKALGQIDKLEKAAVLRYQRSRPSVLEDMRERQAKINERKREAPVRVKTAETEL